MVRLKTTFCIPTIFCANAYSALSGLTPSQYDTKPDVIFRPSRIVSLVSVR